MIRKEFYGKTTDGQEVNRFLLTNQNGMEMEVLEYGAVVRRLQVPYPHDAARKVNVVLGHDSLSGYENDTSTYMGSLVGRVANRIGNSEFVLNGKRYQLKANDGPNYLHGYFHRKVYHGSICGDTLVLERVSPDGEDGFPGALITAGLMAVAFQGFGGLI